MWQQHFLFYFVYEIPSHTNNLPSVCKNKAPYYNINIRRSIQCEKKNNISNLHMSRESNKLITDNKAVEISHAAAFFYFYSSVVVLFIHIHIYFVLLNTMGLNFYLFLFILTHVYL